MSLIHPGLGRLVIFKPVFLDFAKSLGALAPAVSLAAQLVVTAVSFLVAQQPAMLMVMAVGQASLVELLPWVLKDYLHAAIPLGASVILLEVVGVRREKVLETAVRWEVG